MNLINFYVGKIIHQRIGKIEHKFKNLHLFLLINISKIKSCNTSSICNNIALFSINKFNILSWHIKDHGNRKEERIEKLEEYIIKISKVKKFDDIHLLCFPRIFNFGFNPISIYFFSYNNKITHTIYEVKNTFGDIHHYITNNSFTKSIFRKKMFVSPFFKNNGNYEIFSQLKNESVFVNINYLVKNKIKLKAFLNAKIIRSNSILLLLSLLKHIMFPGKVWINIHYQALKLFLKKIKIEKKPLENKVKHTFTEKS